MLAEESKHTETKPMEDKVTVNYQQWDIYDIANFVDIHLTNSEKR